MWKTLITYIYPMDSQDILINAQFAIISAKIDALVSVLNKEQKQIFEKQVLKSTSKIYSIFKEKLSEEDFSHFRTLVEEGIFR